MPLLKKVLIIHSNPNPNPILALYLPCPGHIPRFPHSQEGENDRSYSCHINIKYVNTKSIPAHSAIY